MSRVLRATWPARDERQRPTTHDASLWDAAPQQSARASILAGAGALCVHAGLVALATFIGARLSRDAARPSLVSQLVEIEVPQAPATPATPAEQPAARAAPEHSLPSTRAADPHHDSAPPPAARAGQALTADEKIVDFGDSFVLGKGERYAGGSTEANGTAIHAQREAAPRADGVPSRSGTTQEIDRTRAPQLAGSASWDCPFPVEADDAGLDHAQVSLRIEIGADGHVLQSQISRDPGHGFGREARRCALSKQWSAGLDRAGNATRAVTVVNVRFDR